MQSNKPLLDVQEVVNEIRSRVRGRTPAQAVAPAAPGIETVAPAVSSLDLSRLHQAAYRMRAAQALVGQMPPRPPGLRARIGASLVAAVRRMLFWYTPQILRFQQAAVQAVEEQESAATALGRELAAVSQALQSLQGTVSALEREVAQVRTAVTRQTQELIEPLKAEIDQIEAQTKAGLERSAERLTGIETAVASLTGATSAPAVSPFEERFQAAEARIKDVRQRMDEAIGFTGDRLADLRTQLNLQSRQLAALPERSEHAGWPRQDESDRRSVDSLYARFEDVFRGTREDIKERVRVYLPVLTKAGVGGPDMPVIDIGCGRGEWLELLEENGMQARGVDMNRAMVARCELLGLPAAEADAIEYLRGLPPGSVGGVTAFHVVEHLPFEKLLDLLDETARVLKPGGVAIFETPNPDNLLVGANTFYSDPTHRSPLPAALLKFLAEARGLSGVEIWPLHAYPDGYKLPEDQSGVGQRLNELLYGPQDYGIIGRMLHRS